jgi:hypothetical protein
MTELAEFSKFEWAGSITCGFLSNGGVSCAVCDQSTGWGDKATGYVVGGLTSGNVARRFLN